MKTRITLICLLAATIFAVHASAQDLQTNVTKVHNDAGASVVNIMSKVMTPNLFGMKVPQQGTGSGFVYDDKGHIVTNNHLIQNATKIMVSLTDEEMYEAEVVGSDPWTDLAVLKIDKAKLPPPLQMGDSDALEVGNFVVAIGNSFGLRRTVTFGVISALGRVVQTPEGRFLSEVLQTDAPINPGNSGGPLLNLDGKVIGVNTMILSPSGGSSGIGFAISSNTVNTICPILIEKGRYPHPWLGLETINLNKGLIKFFEKAGVEIPVEEGILVVNVFSGSPADEGDLQTGDQALQIGMFRIPVGGDIIIGIDGQSISAYKDLALYLENKTEIGDTVTVSFYREGQKETAKLTVAERPEQLSIQKVDIGGEDDGDDDGGDQEKKEEDQVKGEKKK